MLNGLQPWHILVLVAVLVVLFGAKRLPDAARGIGKSMRIFKAEAQKLHDDESTSDSSGAQSAQSMVTPPQQIAPQPIQPPSPIEQPRVQQEQQH